MSCCQQNIHTQRFSNRAVSILEFSSIDWPFVGKFVWWISNDAFYCYCYRYCLFSDNRLAGSVLTNFNKEGGYQFSGLLFLCLLPHNYNIYDPIRKFYSLKFDYPKHILGQVNCPPYLCSHCHLSNANVKKNLVSSVWTFTLVTGDKTCGLTLQNSNKLFYMEVLI